MTEPKDFIVQMAEAGPERNSTCPRSHSKWLTELSASDTHWGSVCVCVKECVCGGVGDEGAHLAWPQKGCS